MKGRDRSKALTGVNSTAAAGIASGSGFSATTADGASVQVKFDNSRTLSVTTNGQTTKIRFDWLDGSFKQALADGLNSGGVSAAWTADGRLALPDDSSLMIAAVGGASTLNALGISAGVTNAEVVGTERVADGTEMVVVGAERYVAGSETVVVGTRRVKVGEEEVVTGTETVKVGAERVADGVERKLVGLERVAAAPSLWGGTDGAPRKLPVSVVDVIADVVKFRDSLFSEAESRSAYGFAAGLKEEDAPKLVGARQDVPRKTEDRVKD